MIGEYGRAGDAEHPVALGRYRISNGAISRCFVEINPDVHNSIANGGGTVVGGDGGQHVFVERLIKYELIVRTGRVLRFEVDQIYSIAKDVVGEAGLIGMAVRAIVHDDRHSKDRLGAFLKLTAVERCEVAFLRGGAL